MSIVSQIPQFPRFRRHCSTCSAEREFEQPPCMDGHDPDCPEWLCVECGDAIMVGLDIDADTTEVVRLAA